jgi:hypothetical protein
MNSKSTGLTNLEKQRNFGNLLQTWIKLAKHLNKMETITRCMYRPAKTVLERQILTDYIRKADSAIIDNLGYVVRVLHEDITFFRKMMDHAEGSRISKDTGKRRNIEGLVAKISDKELPAVKEYIFALSAYLRGAPFGPVDAAADKILKLIPIPDTIAAEPSSLFYTTNLARMREEV